MPPPATGRAAPGPPMIDVSLIVLFAVGTALAGCAEERAESHVARLGAPEREERIAAGYQLVLMGESAVAPLVAAATTGSDSLRYIAAQILGRIGSPSGLPCLRALARSHSVPVRREAVLALGRCREPALVGPLADILLRDSVATVRAAAAQGLGQLGQAPAAASLLAALDDTSALVRRSALAGLDGIWTQDAGAAVAAALDDADETARYVAAQLLGRHVVTAAAGALRAALADSSVWVRAEAARALVALADTNAVDDLVRVLERHVGPDADAAREALRALTGMEYLIAGDAP